MVQNSNLVNKTIEWINLHLETKRKETKKMAKAIINGMSIGGSTNYASAINCVDKNGEQSTVQVEIDGLNESVDVLNSKTALITGTTPTTSGITVEINYPDGFTKDNCYVAHFGTYKWNIWYNEYASANSFGVGINLRTDFIGMEVNTESTNGYGLGLNYRLLLCKF